MDIVEIKERSKKLKDNIGLKSSIVGVKFFFTNNQKVDVKVKKLKKFRYCQALMQARHGEHVVLDKDGISCPAAAAAFGFKHLSDGLKNGKGLVRFGITSEENTGKRMFDDMASFNAGEIESLYLFPMETAEIIPDIVIVEDQIETLMWFALSYLNVIGGKRIESSTAILQATCVDATIIPYKQNKMNLSYGCYGCRDATDIKPDESVLGFPFSYYQGVLDHLDYLLEKAIPNSRGKNAFSLLKSREAEYIKNEDIFN